MPDGNPLDNLFDLALQQTFGIKADLWTIASAGVVLLFILIGLDLVKDWLGNIGADNDLKAAKYYKDKERLASNSGDDVMASYYRRKSRQAVSSAARR